MVVRAPASERSPAQADERLLVEAAQKDPARFAELYELHFDRVYLFIARRIGDRDVAEDLTSDVFHKALANLKQFEWRGVPFGAWLLRIAANAVTDRGKRSGRELSFAEPPEIAAQADMGEVEDGARLFRLVNDLPEDQRQVVVMRFAEEKSIREIAGQIGRSEGAVKQLQFRGLENLRARFESGRTRKQRAPGKMKAGNNTGVKNG
ncbi:MAG TPA: sigma-70 family RNA polymerase sigma factor [Terriglobales bacterium]|nr:sigma-70 family RNA polymerase sigma factor [Terriglobales bacterium]